MQRNYSEFIEECKIVFLKELEENNFYWRVYRLSSFKDLIFSKIAKYSNTHSLTDKIELVNLCIKGLIIQNFGQINNSNSTPEEIKNLILSEKNKIIQEYNSILTEKKNERVNKHFLLNDEKSYLKILSQLEPDFFPNQNINQMIIYLLKE